MVSSPLYNIHKTFEENFYDTPFPAIPEKVSVKTQKIPFLGFFLASRIGAAPCAVTTGKGIATLARLGFDVLTYKTIRSHAHSSHALPNIVHLKRKKLLSEADLCKPLVAKLNESISSEKIAISNSFGNGCLAPEIIKKDIIFAKKNLLPGQILIVSVYGEGNTLAEVKHDFVKTSVLAKEAGADLIELNLSCPNLLKTSAPIYTDHQAVCSIISQVVNELPSVPISVKIGLLPKAFNLAMLLQTIADAGAQAVSAINSIPMRVINEKKEPIFGSRISSGVSGFPIRKLALEFIKKIHQIKQEKKLNLSIIGMGGVTSAQHFTEFLHAGADLALSATGMMWNPALALQYHKLNAL